MPQEDYLKRKIDEIARVLAKMLMNLAGLKSTAQIHHELERVSQTLKRELDFDFGELMQTPTDQFIERLLEKKFSNHHLDDLADIIFLFAEEFEKTDLHKANTYYEKCLVLYAYLNSYDATYSIERQLRMEKIENVLKK